MFVLEGGFPAFTPSYTSYLREPCREHQKFCHVEKLYFFCVDKLYILVENFTFLKGVFFLHIVRRKLAKNYAHGQFFFTNIMSLLLSPLNIKSNRWPLSVRKITFSGCSRCTPLYLFGQNMPPRPLYR